MTVTSTLKKGDAPTKEQLERIERAESLPILPDADSPVYSSEQLAFLFGESKKLNAKQTVGLRLSRSTITRYKEFGKGYTSIMAAVLEYSIAHPEILKEAL
jgi:uncharacterized protein (DUF4415 family)